MVDLLVLAMDSGYSDYRNKLGLRPLGAHKISWIARRHGYKAITISKLQLLTEDEIVDLCSRFVGKNTIIGISTTFMSVPDMGARRQNENHLGVLGVFIRAIERIRHHNNHVLVGGAQGSLFSKYFENSSVISGYAENEVVKFLDRKLRHGIQRLPYDWNIKECNFRWSEVDCIQPNEVLTLETGRGCIFSCKFCGWEEIGKRKGTFETNLGNIKSQLIDNFEKFGTTHYLLADDTFNDDDDRMNEWCDMVESLPFKIKYSGFMRIDLMSRYKETTKRLYNTGLRGCHFGIETFHPGASKAIGKSFTGKKGKEFLKELYFDIFEENVAITTTNIIGLPGESLEDVEESFKWYQENDYIHCVWSPLFLTKNLKSYMKPSEFALTPEKYGYSFSDKGDTEWYNKHMTYSEANEMASRIKNLLDYNMSIDSWCGMLHFSHSNLEPKRYIGTKDFELKHRNMELIHQQNMAYFDAVKKLAI